MAQAKKISVKAAPAQVSKPEVAETVQEVEVAKVIEVTEKETKVKNTEVKEEVKEPRKFCAGDMIECRCVRPSLVVFYSTKTDTRYEFGGYGDINEVDFADLQKLKSSKSPILYQPKILIEDPELRALWAKDLEDVRTEYEGIYSTEDVFNKPYVEFEAFLKNASNGVKEMVKIAAVKLIKDKTLTDLSKIVLIDDLLGTRLKEFI